MATKRNRAGQQQNYDSKGRYLPISTEEKLRNIINNFNENKYLRKMKKEKIKIEGLRNRAIHKKDPYLLEAFDTINQAKRNCIKNVNFYVYDNSIKCNREFDIITKNCLIEVKKTGKRCFNQIKSQKTFAENKHLNYILYIPEITKARMREYGKLKILITKNKNELKNAIRRFEK